MRALVMFALLAVSCTDADAALDTLDKAGFTDVSLTGWKPMSCSEEDFSSTGFAAVNSQGKPVEGVVCCGLFLKSCTVRF